MKNRFQLRSNLIRYLLSNLKHLSKEENIYKLCSDIEKLLYNDVNEMAVEALLLKRSFDNAEKFWKNKRQTLIAYLKNIYQLVLNESLFDTNMFFHILIAIKRFINSADLAIPGRHNQVGFFVKPSLQFQKLNKELEELVEAVKPAEENGSGFSHQAQRIFFGACNIATKLLTHGKNNRIITLAMALYCQNIVAEAKPQDPNLIAYFPFSGNPKDTSGNHNDGIIYGAILTQDRFNQEDSAFYFNNGAYIKGSASKFPTTERTVALWFMPDIFQIIPGMPERDRGGCLFAYGGGLDPGPCTGTSWLMDINNRAAPANNYELQSHCATNQLLFPGVDNKFITPSTWAHWAITTDYYRGTIMYLNGMRVTQHNTIFVSNTRAQGTEYGIGTCVYPDSGKAGYTDINVVNFKGVIDEVRIYNRALEENEIKDLYHSVEDDKRNVTNTIVCPEPKTPEPKTESGIGPITGGIIGSVLTFCGFFCVTRCIQPGANPDEIQPINRGPGNPMH